MRILHVSPSFWPAHAYGGPIVSTYELCRHLAALGHEVRVLTTDAAGKGQVLEVDRTRPVEVAPGVVVRYHHRVLSGLAAPGLVGALPGAVRRAELVHLTGVYSFPTWPTLLACRALNRPLVWSPRGSLRHHPGTTRATAKKAWEWVCRAVAPRRVALHVTAAEEAIDSEARLPSFRSTVIPNGVELPPLRDRPRRSGPLRLLFVGRLHPIKGLENLIDACGLLRDADAPDWTLTLAGSGETEYVNALKERATRVGIAPRIRFLGDVRQDAKEQAFAEADVVVLPSYRENFGMAVAEGLARGLPVIASRGTPWARLESEDCGLWVENTPGALAAAVRKAARLPLGELGSRGRAWMEHEFGWSSIAARMAALYSELFTGRG